MSEEHFRLDVMNQELAGVGSSVVLVALALVLTLPSTSYAYSYWTACGESSDGGVFGYVQIGYGSNGPMTLEGGANTITYYGSGAGATLYTFIFEVGVGHTWHALNTTTFTHAPQTWDTGLRNYDGSTARIVAYDGNPNTGAGTITGIIIDGQASPACRYQAPTR